MKKNLGRIIRVGSPLLAGQLSHYIMNVVDTAMVGRLDSTSLAAMAIGGLFTNILFVLIWPMSVGTQAIASRRFGAEENSGTPSQETAAVLNNTFVLALLFGTGAFCLSFLAPILLPLLVDDEELLELSLQYIVLFRWCYLPAAFAMAINGFCSSVRKTTIVMFTTIASNVLNVILNYLFIFGKFGFPALRIRGAALGTVLSHLIILGVFVLYLRGCKDFKRYHFLRRKDLEPALMKRIVKIMLPPMIQNGIAMSLFLAYESLIGLTGTIYLAVTHVAFSLFRINKTIVGGFSKGASILVGNALGTGDIVKARSYIKAMKVLAIGIGLVIMATIYFFPEFIFSLFSSDAKAVEIAVKALRFFCFFFFIEIIGFPLEIVFQQNGWGRFILFSEFVSNIIFLLAFPQIMYRIFGFGIQAVWWGFALYQVLHSGILHSGWFSGRWEKALGREI